MSLQEKLVLFDIDGTILTGPSVGKNTMLRAARTLYGPDIVDDIDFHGQTDSSILFRMLASYIPAEDRDIQLLSPFFELYVKMLREYYTIENGVRLIEGAREFIEYGAQIPGLTFGLLTGNIEESARIKLEIFQLNQYFPFGAFGNEAVERPSLAELAVKKAQKLYQKDFTGKDIIIIGDTQYDVLCGKGLDAYSVAIITNPALKPSIEKAEPDKIIHSFFPIEQKWEEILSMQGDQSLEKI